MPAAESPPSLRVVTLNIASLIEPGWEERRHETVRWVDDLDPDILCLQEVTESPDNPNTAGWLVEHFAAEWHMVFGGPAIMGHPDDPGGEILFGSAICSRTPIDDHEMVPLPIDHEGGAKDPFYALPLELLWARTGGVDVFSTHLAPPPAQAYHRVQQILFIDDQIKRIAATNDGPIPPILCGDFNAEPNSDEIRFLSSLAVIEGRSTYYQDAWRAAANEGPGLTWDSRVAPLAAAMHLPPKRLDYCFVGDPFGRRGAGHVLRCDLAFHEPRTGVYASDHFGLVTEIQTGK